MDQIQDDFKLEIDRIFHLQQRFRWEVKKYHPEHRINMLNQIEKWIQDHSQEIVRALDADFKKPEFETLVTEIYTVLNEIKFIRKSLFKWVKPEHRKRDLLLFGAHSEVHYEPKGTVLIISPWNYPFSLALVPLVTALAAGNTVILKPSELTPQTSLLVQKMVRDIFPPDWVHVFLGGTEVAEKLTQLPFDHCFFTGSTKVGRMVYQAAAANLTPCTLELGGKSPTIIDQHANLALAAKKIVWGKFLNGGQTCVAPDYVFVTEDQEVEFLEHLKHEIVQQGRAGLHPVSPMADIISERHFLRLKNLLDLSIEKGAKIEYGGLIDLQNFKISPTILSSVDLASPIMTEEIFGPILPILRYSDMEQIIHFISDRPKPLALYIFSNDDELVSKVISQTSSGGVCVNDVAVHLGNHHLPFGGVGESGMGNYHGEFGFKTFSHARAVMKQSFVFGALLHLLYPPYRDWQKKFLKMFIG